MARPSGRQKTGGRKPGTPNKAAAEAKLALAELARTHAPEALQALVDVAARGQSESARVAAAVALLDRGYGKPYQQVRHADHEGGPLGREAIAAAEQVLDALDTDELRLMTLLYRKAGLTLPYEPGGNAPAIEYDGE